MKKIHGAALAVVFLLGVMKNTHGRRVGTIAAVLLCTTAIVASTSTRKIAFEGNKVDSGIAVDLALENPAGGALYGGETARLTVRLADQASHAPLRGIYPNAWIGRLADDGPLDRKRCLASVAAYLGGNLLSGPDVDINVFYVLVLNADATITVVDPRFSFGGSRLLALVQLRAPGYDWALTADSAKLFVSMPSAGAVAVVDTATWKVIDNVAVGPNPSRIVLQPDGEQVWVASDWGAVALRPRDGAVAARIAVGAGRHDLAASNDGRHLFVTNGEDASVTVVDTRKLRASSRIALPSPPVSIAFSALSGMAYAASAGGTIAVIDPDSAKPRAVIDAQPGIRQVRVAPGGRYAFVVNPARDLVQIIDTAASRVVQNGTIGDGPFEVTFSESLAYIRRLRSDVVLMVPLADVGARNRQIPVIDFPAGQKPFGDRAALTGADGIVSAPGEDAVLVAHPLDEKIYYYREGMAAPIGHFPNYGHEPRAVLVVDRSLRESTPGVFSALTKLPNAGKYNVAVYVDSPRVVACFEVAIVSDPHDTRPRVPRVEPLNDADVVKAGSKVRVAFLLTDPVTRKPVDGLRDAGVLVYNLSGGWNDRQRLEAEGGGKYDAEIALPSAGVYYVYVESASAGLRANNASYLILQAQ